MQNEKSSDPRDYMKDGSPAPRKHVRATNLPGVWMKLKFAPNTLPPRSAGGRRDRHSGTNGTPGLRARQRAAATGSPVDHRGPRSKAKRRREASQRRKAAAS